MNKKAVQLTINFIVMLIISLVVFGMGLSLFRKFFVEADVIKQNLDDQTKKEIQQIMMSSAEQVVIYPSQLTIRQGKSDIVGIGILNINDASTLFVISPSFDGAACYDNAGSIMSGCSVNDIKYTSVSRSIESNEREIFDVPIRVSSDAQIGKYAVVISVTGGATSTNIVYIKVI